METIAEYKPKVEVVSDAENLARRSLEIFVDTAREAIEKRGVFHVAISGGAYAQALF